MLVSHNCICLKCLLERRLIVYFSIASLDGNIAFSFVEKKFLQEKCKSAARSSVFGNIVQEPDSERYDTFFIKTWDDD